MHGGPRTWSLALALALGGGCRLGFDAAPDAALDAAPDAAQGVTVFVDFSDAYTYVQEDFVDGENILNNVVQHLCVLDPVFGSPLALVAGRAVYELRPDGAIVHDLTPVTNDAAGPDEPGACLSASTPSTGPVLWLGAGSYDGGDGLYYLTPSWELRRDIDANNVGAIYLDAAGVHTGGAPDIVYSASTQLHARPAHAMVGSLMARRNVRLAPVADGSIAALLSPEDFSSYALARVAIADLAITDLLQLPTPRPALATDAAPPSPVFAYGIIARRLLVAFRGDGSYDVIATSPDPDDRWLAVTWPPSTHPLAGAWYVAESNRTLDRDRILRIPAP